MTLARQRVTQVHRAEQGLVASCTGCGLALETVGGFDPDVALGTWSLFHPASPEALHRPAVPAGWHDRWLDSTRPDRTLQEDT